MKINYEKNTLGYLDITFGPVWDYIPLTRNYIENFLLINLIDKKNINKISLATSELLENAMKYTSSDVIRLKIIKKQEDNRIEISVYNYADKKQAEKLLELLSNMSENDPFEFYVLKMKQISKKDKNSSNLGLARINYEAQAKLYAEFDDKTKILETHAQINLN